MEPTPLAQTINLTSKVAIVTGGAVGIGFGIAYRLAEAGAAVLIADANREAADRAAARLQQKGWTASSYGADISNAEQVAHVVAATVATHGGVDILVNNAGIYPSVPVLQMQEHDFDHIVTINLKGVFLCTQAVAKQMIAQGRGGKIINITSIDALHPSAIGLAAYDASKHGLWGFTKNTALELAEHKIWVNAIAPGGIRTPGTGMDTLSDEQLDANTKAFRSKIPMHRMGEPDDIGKVALFLASDLAIYMTGTQIVVDGGFLIA